MLAYSCVYTRKIGLEIGVRMYCVLPRFHAPTLLPIPSLLHTFKYFIVVDNAVSSANDFIKKLKSAFFMDQ